jgi:cell division inhibitor SepF
MGDKFIDKIKYFWGVETRDVEEDSTEDFYDELKRKDLDSDESTQSISAAPERSQQAVGTSTNTIKTANKVLNIHSNAQMNVVLISPKRFDESTGIIDTLKSRRPVVMNLSELDRELARKIFDFCSGALYALEGHIQQISKGIFILAPQNVEISGGTIDRDDEEDDDDGVHSWLRE